MSLLDCRKPSDQGLPARVGCQIMPRVSSIALRDHAFLPAERGSFLRIPPFPGAAANTFEPAGKSPPEWECIAGTIDSIRRFRVGGTYWAAQPDLPSKYLLVRSPAASEHTRQLAGDYPTVTWQSEHGGAKPGTAYRYAGDCDPWHMLSGAVAVVCDARDEVVLIANILGVPAYAYDSRSDELELLTSDPTEQSGEILPYGSLRNPFSGEAMSVGEAIELCGFWRSLIDSNRGIAGGMGFAFWKQDNVAPLLWDGSAPFRFLRSIPDGLGGKPVAIWRSRTAPEILADLDQSGVPLIEVEDGFLRSNGLGADCVPPLSITVDRLGPYFDPSQPSELELLLENGDFDESTVARANRLRQVIMASGLSKYDRGSAVISRPAGRRRHILVPGQVEDDRSVQSGGCGISTNLDLLRHVREQSPDAYILYKPHPDVLAGHRKGTIREPACLEHADQIAANVSIAALIDMVDEVHVNTSLSGFEALLRGKEVTTYGVPFYSGWGLTRDLGPVPARRTKRRTIDELVAATLLLYPRYLDPLTGLPCPAEVVVDRLGSGQSGETGIVVALRRMQGRIRRKLRVDS